MLIRGWVIRPGAGYSLSDEQRVVAFQAERAVRIQQHGPGKHVGAVLLIILHQRCRPVQGSFLLAALPERSLQPGVEPVVNGEKVPHIVPDTVQECVVNRHAARRGLGVAHEQSVGERARLEANHHQRGGLQRFDKARRIAHCDHIFHPRAGVAAGSELNDPGFSDPGIFGAVFRLRRFIAEVDGAENVAAIDDRLVVNAPAPAGVHRFGGGETLDGLIRPRPAADDGAVAEERVAIADKRLLHRASEQLRSKTRGIHEQVRTHAAAVIQMQRRNSTVRTSLHAGDGGVAHDHSRFEIAGLQPADEFFVLNVPGKSVADRRCSIWLAGKDLRLIHERGVETRVGEVVRAVIAVGLREILPLPFDLLGKSIVERRARAPEITDAQFPDRLSLFVKGSLVDFQILMEMGGKIRRGAFAHAYDADRRTAQDRDIELG